jgi:ribosomal protein S18 acetylase RimI-like enzyme
MTIEPPSPQDIDAIIRVTEDVGVFNPLEVRVVREMLETFFHTDNPDDYKFIVYRNGDPNGVAGFACFGPTPLADRIWDLYWICVQREQQSNGIGSNLLRRVEDAVCRQGARAIYLETSDSPAYQPAREFYERHAYKRVAHLPDFYAPGEGKIIYCKTLQ